MIRENPVPRGVQVEARMEILQAALVDTQSLAQFCAALLRILLVLDGGGLVAALACILWLLRFDETPLGTRPNARLRAWAEAANGVPHPSR